MDSQQRDYGDRRIHSCCLWWTTINTTDVVKKLNQEFQKISLDKPTHIRLSASLTNSSLDFETKEVSLADPAGPPADPSTNLGSPVKPSSKSVQQSLASQTLAVQASQSRQAPPVGLTPPIRQVMGSADVCEQ